MLEGSIRLYKLIVLYSLFKSRDEITGAIISDFILEYGYTDYLSIQETLTEMCEQELITAQITHKTSYYEITDKGRQTLDDFISHLPQDTIEQIDEFLENNQIALQEATTVKTDFKKLDRGNYLATGTLMERGQILLQVSIQVPSEQDAIKSCKRFEDNKDELYAQAVKLLF